MFFSFLFEGEWYKDEPPPAVAGREGADVSEWGLLCPGD